MSTKRAWYLAGPMSTIPQCNYPAFNAAALDLRNHGLKIISPAELDDIEFVRKVMLSKDGSIPPGTSWADLLARDVKIVADKVGGIIFMPGWEKSRGARLEAFVGLLCGHRFRLYTPGYEVPVSKLSASQVRMALCLCP